MKGSREETKNFKQKEKFVTPKRKACPGERESLSWRKRKLVLAKEKACPGEKGSLSWRKRKLVLAKKKACPGERSNIGSGYAEAEGVGGVDLHTDKIFIMPIEKSRQKML